MRGPSERSVFYMSKKVAIFVGNGTEPVEAVAPADALTRGNVAVDFISVMQGTEVNLAQNIKMQADMVEGRFDPSDYDMIVIPGGSVGVENLAKSGVVADALRQFMGEGRKVSSICAGPTILADMGLLEGYRATCYPGCQTNFPAGCYQDVRGVVVDRNLITAAGPGQALDFGIAMLRSLAGDEVADSVKAGMLVS